MRVALYAAAQALRRHRPGCCFSGHRLITSSVSAAMLPAHRQQQQPGRGMSASTCLFRVPHQAATSAFSRAVQCYAAAAGARSRRAHHAAVRTTTQRQLHTEPQNLQHLCSDADHMSASQLHAPLVMPEVAAPAAAELGMLTHQDQDQQQQHAGQGAASGHQQQQQQRYLEHLQQHVLPTEVLLIGIDPDTNGAIAVVSSQLHWSLTDGSSSNGNSREHVQKTNSSGHGSKKDSSSGSTTEVPQLQAHMGLPAAVSVYDMPVQAVVTQTKTHTGKRRVRRYVGAYVCLPAHVADLSASPSRLAECWRPAACGLCSCCGGERERIDRHSYIRLPVRHML